MTQEERLLWEHVKSGDDDARAELARLHNGLAYFALKAINITVAGVNEPTDLEQIAKIGLLHAIDNFDIGKGFAFSTYAVHVINRYIIGYLDLNNPDLPRSSCIAIRKIIDVQTRYQRQGDGTPTTEDLMNETGYSRRFVEDLLGYQRRQMLSLNSLVVSEDGEDNSEDVIPGKAEDPCSVAIRHSLAETVQRAITALSKQEATVVGMKLAGRKAEEIRASIGGRSRQRVDQIYHGALKKMRVILEAAGFELADWFSDR